MKIENNLNKYITKGISFDTIYGKSPLIIVKIGIPVSNIDDLEGMFNELKNIIITVDDETTQQK